MRRTWRSAEAPATVPASDVASEIVWGSLAGVAVFDHSGRLAYSNPTFRQSSLLSELVDGRGYLASAALEGVRREVVHRGDGSGPRSTRTVAGGHTLDVEVVPLKVAPEWTAMVIRGRGTDSDPSSDALTLSLLVHELRGPLLLAQESLEVLTQLADGSPAELRDAVARQGRSLTRLTGLVQGLSDLSRARALDRTRHSWTAVDLARQVDDVAEIYRELAVARGFDLVVALERDVPAIDGHAELLARAIANLVDNALKYASAPGPIRLSLRRSGALAVVEVADSGPGIAQADQPSIFTEFYRLPAARAARTPGTGLGLAVARRVAQAHGGRLSLESQVGAGSAFRLSFLLARGGRIGVEPGPRWEAGASVATQDPTFTRGFASPP
jgi:signal transduction histidine kinase